jgi:hypothetical protein
MQQPRPTAPSIFVGIDEKRVPPVLIIHGLTWPGERVAEGISGNRSLSPYPTPSPNGIDPCPFLDRQNGFRFSFVKKIKLDRSLISQNDLKFSEVI